VGRTDKTESAKIGFPVACEYRGGNLALGKHGRHIWIQNGEIGHGSLRLSHGIPLAGVTSVEVTERQVGGSNAQTLMAFGTLPFTTKHASKPKQITDIVVRTRNGDEALRSVEQRGADWVRNRLTPALRQARIPYFN
jgi:hypothetical protein